MEEQQKDPQELFAPINRRIMVKIDVEPEMTKGGLWIPESARQKSDNGWIVAMDPAIPTIEPDFTPKVGDRILFDKYAGTALKLYGIDYIVVPTDSVLGIMK